jgi:hypothetical protein
MKVNVFAPMLERVSIMFEHLSLQGRLTEIKHKVAESHERHRGRGTSRFVNTVEDASSDHENKRQDQERGSQPLPSGNSVRKDDEADAARY